MKKALAWSTLGMAVLGLMFGLLYTRGPLDDSIAEASDRFDAVVPNLVQRFKAADRLSRAIDKTTDRDDATDQLQEDYKLWSKAIEHRGNVIEKVTLANQLESDLTRLQTAITKSPLLSGDENVNQKLAELNSVTLDQVLIGEFNEAARRYEAKRHSVFSRASSAIFSYASIPQLATPKPT